MSVCVCIGMGAQTWQLQPRQGHHLSFLHTLRDSLLEKLRRSRSFGDLAALRPRPRSSLEVYVSQVVVCAQLPSKHVCVCVCGDLATNLQIFCTQFLYLSLLIFPLLVYY